MATVTVKFDRIGRREDVPDLVVEAEPGERHKVLTAIGVYAGWFLPSREYDVEVDLDAGTGDIDGGRFGTFMIEVQGA